MRISDWSSDVCSSDLALCADMDIVVQEDVRLLSKIQRSIQSGYFTGMVLNYHERGVYWYNQEIDSRIGIDAVPTMLRIAKVMQLVSSSALFMSVRSEGHRVGQAGAGRCRARVTQRD